MTKQEALDRLARAVAAERRKGRIKEIRKAFAEYVETLETPSWWKRVWTWLQSALMKSPAGFGDSPEEAIEELKRKGNEN
jgi:hypothetical protein